MSQDVLDAPSTEPPTPPPDPAPATVSAPIESPPPAAQPAREGTPDPRARLHQLAAELTRSRNRRLLIEFLQLRRALR
jgi:hypothetical protein